MALQFLHVSNGLKQAAQRLQNRVAVAAKLTLSRIKHGVVAIAACKVWLGIPWSLQTVARRDDKEWRKFNRYRRSVRLSPIDKILLFGGEYPVRFSFFIFCLLGIVFYAGKKFQHVWLPTKWGVWQASEQLTYFSTLWSVQATLAALVYPIVIAFVTVFLQRRPAAQAFVHLYVLDSAALVAGLSSVTLVVVMAVQYALIPILGAEMLPALVAVDAIWFLLNATFTAYFLFRTIEFLRPEVQARIIRRYAINVALPRDVIRLNLFQILTRAQTNGWIPAPGLADVHSEEGPKVIIHRFWLRDGESQGTISINEPKRIVDIRLWPLRLVVKFWMRAASRWPRPEQEHQWQRKWPRLIIPATPGIEYKSSISLAYVDAGPRLNAWQRWLLRRVIVFRSVKKERYGIQVKAILDELEADVREAAAKSDVESFERSYDAMVALHKLLLGACLFENETGTIDSWALLPDLVNLFDRTLHAGWSDAYRSVYLAAINSMAGDVRPVRMLCHLITHLADDALVESPIEVREQILKLPPLMMYQLSGWWTRQVEEQGIMEHDHRHMITLRPPKHSLYEEVIATFVGGWENAHTIIAGIPDSPKAFEWESAKSIVRLSVAHLQETVRMLLAAINRGDRVAAEWLADVVNKWWGGMSHEREVIALFDKTEFLTLGHLEFDWTKLCSLLGITDRDIQVSGGDVRAVQRRVLVATLHNFWIDLRLLTFELSIFWANQDETPSLASSLAMEIATGFLNGRRWRSGGTQTEPLRGNVAADYLNSKIRQYAGDGKGRGGYEGMLSVFIERLKDVQRPEMIGSRVYSFGGADDLASLQDQELVLLIVLSSADWIPHETLKRQIEIWMKHQFNSVAAVQHKLQAWESRIDQASDFLPKVTTELLSRCNKSHDTSKGLERVKVAIGLLKDFVDAARNSALDTAPVDAARLKKIAEYASSKGFNAETGTFPLQLFDEIVATNDSLEDYTFFVKPIRKGELTGVEMNQRPMNEEESWAETMAWQVGYAVLFDILGRCKICDLMVPSAPTYWAALKTESEKMIEQGLHPILILDNATRPEWVWQWQYADYGGEYTRPEDMRVQRLSDRGDGYVCDFDDIAVFTAPLSPGQSILLPRETFYSLKFQTFDANRFVEVSVLDRSDSKHLVDLVLKFSRQVQIHEQNVVRLLYEEG